VGGQGDAVPGVEENTVQDGAVQICQGMLKPLKR